MKPLWITLMGILLTLGAIWLQSLMMLRQIHIKNIWRTQLLTYFHLNEDTISKIFDNISNKNSKGVDDTLTF